MLRQGWSPSRTFAGLFSHLGELYLYGGAPTSIFLRETRPEHCYTDKEPFMMKLDQESHVWVPVSLVGAPQNTWSIHHCTSRGQQSPGTEYHRKHVYNLLRDTPPRRITLLKSLSVSLRGCTHGSKSVPCRCPASREVLPGWAQQCAWYP